MHTCLSKGPPIMSLFEQSGLKSIISSEYSKTYYRLRWFRNSAWILFTFSSCTSPTCTNSSKHQHFQLSQNLEALWHTLNTHPGPRNPYSLPSGKCSLYLGLLLGLSHDLSFEDQGSVSSPSGLEVL